MSWFDSIFSSNDSADSIGREVLRGYFDEASQFSEFQYAGDFDAWISSLQMKVSDIVELIGDLVKSNYASTTVDQAVNRARDLANQSSGTATISQMVAAAGGSGDSVNWSAAIPEIAYESGADALETVQNAGAGIISTVNMTKYLPYILLAAGGLYIFTIAKSTGGGIGKALGSRIKRS